jgi:N-ethylmaleimide reductase
MSSKYPALLSPFDLSGIELKNRVVLAPMTRSRGGTEYHANQLVADYYSQRAGAGLLITEGSFVSEEAIGWLNVPSIYTRAMSDAWKVVTDSVHKKGTPIFLQLWHCGRASHSAFQNGKLAGAPSAIAIQGDPIHTPKGKMPQETPREMTIADIKKTVEDYRQAAQYAKDAGFDGVEIHSANGYLLDSFLQSKTNHRTDEYGGSLENRFRFLRQVLEAVSSVFPSNRIGVRLSPNGVYNDMGSPDFRETFLYAAEQLSAFNLCYLHVLDGLAFGFHKLGEPVTLSDLRGVYKGTLMGNCGYEAATADATIADGKADLIAFGRPFIANPDLVERFAHDWPLADLADMKTWYSFDEKGYADYPTYEEAHKEKSAATP